MKRILAVLLLLATLFSCKSDPGPETVNQADGTHEMFKSKNANWPMDRKITFNRKWQSCTWYTEVQDAQGAPRRVIKRGTEKDYAYVVWVDGRRAWITFDGCGKPEVHR